MNLVSLASVSDIIMGQSPPSSTYNNDGLGLPFFQGKSDFGDIFSKIRMFCVEPNKIAEKGDILISIRAPVGPTNISPERSCIGRGLAALRPREKLNQRFLLYYLRWYEPQWVLASKGSTFKAITKSDLLGVQIPLLPIDKQNHIAAILTKADRLRRLRRYALEISDTFLQSVFLLMFGDPITNPMGWRIGKLEDVLTDAKDGPHVSPEYSETGIPFLSTRNVRPGEVIWDDLKYISAEEARRQWKKIKPEYGDILYTKGGTTGLAKAVDFHRDIAVWVHIAVLKLNKELVHPIWLENMLNSNFCYQQSQHLTKGIVNRDLGLRRMPRIKMYFPPLSKQEHFVRLERKFRRTIRQQREAIHQSNILFSTLLHRAFQGDL